MGFINFLKNNFTRKVSEDRNYIASADGIRFWATVHVIFGHILVYTTVKNPSVNQSSALDFLYYFIATPGLGLEIFYVLSGFLLVLPFVNYYINNAKQPNLGLYYARRLTRLEIPYIIALTFSTLALWLILKKFTFSELLPQFISSLFYSNHFFYEPHPIVLEIAWTLETDVQFYILVPVFALLFKLKKQLRRWIMLFFILVVPPLIEPYIANVRIYILHWYEYFLAGIFLADLYLDKEIKVAINKNWLCLISVIVLMPLFHIVKSYHSLINYILPMLIFVFLYIVIKLQAWKQFFNNVYLRMIGVMSYSIYLWHYMCIAFFGKFTLALQLGNNVFLNFLIQVLLLVPIILLVSGLMFIKIERPCMYSNAAYQIVNWFKRKK